jgi:thiol:disulfide interchange protein DsbC
MKIALPTVLLATLASAGLITAALLVGPASAVETPKARTDRPAAATPEAALAKALSERLPQLPKIDEISKTPVPGLFEVRYGGTEILYSDEAGDHILTGSMIDTKSRADLTEARIEKLLAVDFDKLPLKDAMPIKQGSGARKLAVFVDPNCGYCKRFERDLAAVKDVTIYTFLIPILGPDSTAKARDIWCAKDASATWRAWMLDGVVPGKSEAKCDATPIDRNLAFAQKQKINGTPAILFADGTRKPGAIPPALLEKLLVAAATPAAAAAPAAAASTRKP